MHSFDSLRSGDSKLQKRAIWIGSWLVVALSLGGVSQAGPAHPDDAVTYLFDLTRAGDKKPTILALKLPSKVWQHGDHPLGWAPGTAVRKAWGAAFWYIDEPLEPGTAAHAYLEIEPLGDRKLKAAVAESLDQLGKVCANAKNTLRKPPSKPKRYKKLKLGRKKVTAYHTEYSVSPPAMHGAGEFRSEALFFALNDHLVTLSVDNMGANEFFDVFVKALALAKTLDTKKDQPFKLFFMEAGESRFLTFRLPPGFRRDYRYSEGKHAAVWEEHDDKGQILTRLTVSESWAHKIPLKDVMDKRAKSERSKHESFAGPEKISVSDREAWQVTFRDTNDGVRDVRKVYIRFQNQDYTLCWETRGGDKERVAADRKRFDELLARARVWRSRVS
jgi:hypothetical protein